MSSSTRLSSTLSKNKLLSIYFTANFPYAHTTVTILRALQEAGADMVELGIPFSDPLADGTTIQHAHHVALENGFSFDELFDELKDVRSQVSIPIIAMTYFNPILQYGMERFLNALATVGIDGIIVPDLPIDVYEKEYKSSFNAHGISFVPIVLPNTKADRIKKIYQVADDFVYLLSSSSTTGKQLQKGEMLGKFFIDNASHLSLPTLIGFGIRTKEDLTYVCQYAQGGIVGSSFIDFIRDAKPTELADQCRAFVQQIKLD